jgi:NO-binding membrane sensor protein with MHYT domain
MGASEMMTCHDDQGLVVVSILISIMAAFAARELLGRINEGFCRSRRSVIQERLGAS